MPPAPSSQRTVLVVLSGGQDSATCLFWAKQHFEVVHAVTFNYGQRHAVELEAAEEIASLASVASHEVVDLGPVLIGSSPLVNPDIDVGRYARPEDMPAGVEPTFVPGRNALFLVIAANRAMALGAKAIVLGVSQEDFGGYPDCREAFVNSMGDSLSEAMVGQKGYFSIHTPLMKLTKQQTVEMAATLPGCMDALAFSHTDYNGLYPPDPLTHSSMLRARGFRQAALPDPLILRAKKEALLPTDYPDDGYVVGTKWAKPNRPLEELSANELRAIGKRMGLEVPLGVDQSVALKQVREKMGSLEQAVAASTSPSEGGQGTPAAEPAAGGTTEGAQQA